MTITYQQDPIKTGKRNGNRFIPTFIPCLIGLFQMILCLAIIGLESGGVYYDAGRGTIYAGFWCSTIFFITWIGMFCFICTGRANACGIYIVIMNLISGIFAIILIIFTSLFIQNPCRCYNILCNVPSWNEISNLSYYPSSYNYNRCTPRVYDKLPLLKGLLACAVLMLLSNIIFIILYLITYIRLRSKLKHYLQQQQQPELHTYVLPPPTAPPSNEYDHQYVIRTTSEPHYYTDIVNTQYNLPSAPIQMRSYRF